MKKITTFLVAVATMTTAYAQDAYEVLSINSEWPVKIADKPVSVGDKFDSQDLISWSDKKQSMDVKQVASGNVYRVSRRQFAAKGRDVKSIQGLYSYTAVDVARDEQGRQKVNLTMKESNKSEFYPEKRFAIVIGNSFYSAPPALQGGLPALAEAQKKAEMLTDSLSELGYDVVESYDLNTIEMKTLLSRFASFANEYAVGMVYYAGHAVTIDGETMLVPVNMKGKDDDMKNNGMAVSEVLKAMAKSKCQELTLVLDTKDMATGTPAALNPVDGTVTKEDGTAVNVKVMYSISDDFLGNHAENLYVKKKNEEAKEKEELMAAINSLASLEEQKTLTTPEDFYEEGMRLADKSMPDYNIDNAITYLKKAANKGHAESMYQLALIYDKKDAVQSMIWMGRASAAGHQKAKEYVAARKQKPNHALDY